MYTEFALFDLGKISSIESHYAKCYRLGDSFIEATVKALRLLHNCNEQKGKTLNEVAKSMRTYIDYIDGV